jgi:hypothetical protein
LQPGRNCSNCCSFVSHVSNKTISPQNTISIQGYAVSLMQRTRRIYAGEGHSSGVFAQASHPPENPSDDSNIVKFLLRNLPRQVKLLASLRDNSEIIEVDIDLMEWADADVENEHAIMRSILFNFPNIYKNISIACDYLKSAISMDASMRAIHSSQLRCNIKLPCPEILFGSNPNTGEKMLRNLRGRIAAIQFEKQIVKSRTFSCTNDNCRQFMKDVTHNFWYFDDVEGTAPLECSSCGICCIIEDVSACQVAEHQIWTIVSDKQIHGRSTLCQVSVFENVIENPQSFLGCQVEMVVLRFFCCLTEPQ